MIGVVVPGVFAESLDELTINAHSVDRLPFSTYDIIFVQFDLTNNSLNPKMMSYSEAILIDTNGRKFTMSSHSDLYELGISSSYSECPMFLSTSDINPGITKEYSACFQIPKDGYPFFLKISGIYGESYQLGYERQIETDWYSLQKTPEPKPKSTTWDGASGTSHLSPKLDKSTTWDGASGTSHLSPKLDKSTTLDSTLEEKSTEEGGGCLIATATYGSELASQVQQLRELRDNQLLNTESGTAFMGMFNDVYYSFSPMIADYERENPLFKEAVKLAITPMISSLSLMGNAESESEVLSIGISVIMLNLGMYLGIPAIVIVGIKKKF